MKESTKQLFRGINGWRHPLYFVHGYLYFTQYDRYVKLALMFLRRYIRVFPRGRWFFDYLIRGYHFKVLTGEQATQILSLDHEVMIDPDLAKRVIPFPVANRIILSQPDHIAVMDCPCRLEKGDKACLPINVCIAVGEPVVNFWLEHGQRLHARQITSAEAIDIVRSERARGHITCAWFKDATGGKTGVFCNCCSCCCAGMEAIRMSQRLKVEDPPHPGAPSGYSVNIDSDKCNGCGICSTCNFSAVLVEGGKMTVIDTKCMGCGICVERCPQGALSLVADDRKGVPLDIRMLEEIQAQDK
ncbi:MAG: 4Fe-4S binding protein [Smithellaceae bacterium]|nr:4Fe-4S binding protein [Smithellaceae bacterium]